MTRHVPRFVCLSVLLYMYSTQLLHRNMNLQLLYWVTHTPPHTLNVNFILALCPGFQPKEGEKKKCQSRPAESIESHQFEALLKLRMTYLYSIHSKQFLKNNVNLSKPCNINTLSHKLKGEYKDTYEVV